MRCPAPASTRRLSGAASAKFSTASRRATARCSRHAKGCRANSTAGTAPIWARISIRPNIRASCATSAILSLNPMPLPSIPRALTTKSRRSPGRSSSPRCSTLASCSTPPMPAGAASTTRSTAATRSPARRTGRAMMRRAVRVSSPGAATSSTLRCPSPMAHGPIGTAIRRCSPILPCSSAFAARAICCAITASTSKSSSTATTRSARAMPPASPISSSNRRFRRSAILRIRSLRSMPPTRSRAMPTGWA